MDGIADMVTDLVQTYHSISDEQKSMFGGKQNGQEALGSPGFAIAATFLQDSGRKD